MQINDEYTPKVPRNHVWLFNSADGYSDFSGNTKYLFIYINKYRPDIFACYLSANEDCVKKIRELGYKACTFKSIEGRKLIQLAGVYVNDQCKTIYPKELQDSVLLNLFHGIGLKAIEKRCANEGIGLSVAKKHILYSDYFSKKMCFLATSPFMEEHFKNQLSLRDDQIIRSLYPRNVYQKNYEKIKTFNHNFLQEKVVSNSIQIALYAPTFRQQNTNNFLYSSISDIFTLIDSLKKNNIFLIIKLHPNIKDDFLFQKFQNITNLSSNIMLWDNNNDIYEIIDKIDIGIIDYSSIFYDLLAAGTKKFIRYIFDFEDEEQTLIYNYFDNTCGLICKNFADLISALDIVKSEEYESENLEEIKNKFWSYSAEKACCEDIINQTLSFQPQYISKCNNLYSFDIFDTLIARKVLQPRGIFFAVMEKIRDNYNLFPSIFATKYPLIRMQAEANAREYLKKRFGISEISFDDIFTRLADVYHLKEQQINLLRQWEIDTEIENIIPIQKNLDFAKQLITDGEKVILISDMYLPKEIIQKMLGKVSESLTKVPLFLSTEYGHQKANGELYYDAYKYFEPYQFKEWHHYGDNNNSDVVQAKKLGISPHLHTIPSFNKYEAALVDYCRTYDSYLIAGMLSRMRHDNNLTIQEYYVIAHIAFYFVPYVAWVVQDAIKKGFEVLYFLSRDGFFLKKIADIYIKIKKLDIKTKYLYTSRRVTRIPSIVDSVDDEFFSNFGNFSGVTDYDSLLQALDISDHMFQRLFPELNMEKTIKISSRQLVALREFFKKSSKFHRYIVEKAKNERELVVDYLKQEIDFNKKNAFVEFWARGYTQSKLGTIFETIKKEYRETHFYYYRSIYPSIDKDYRYNFSTNTTSLIFIEAIFANLPYGTVTSYRKQGSRIEAIYAKNSFDATLYSAMDIYLPIFIQKFYALPFRGSIATIERLCSDFSLYWYKDHQNDPVYVKSIAHLRYSGALHDAPREFAPPITEIMLRQFEKGEKISAVTNSIKMSLARSTPAVCDKYKKLANGMLTKTSTSNIPIKSLSSSRKSRLMAKLDRNPQAFFVDSRYLVLRAVGRTCFSPVLGAHLGKALVWMAKFYLRKLDNTN